MTETVTLNKAGVLNYVNSLRLNFLRKVEIIDALAGCPLEETTPLFNLARAFQSTADKIMTDYGRDAQVLEPMNFIPNITVKLQASGNEAFLNDAMTALKYMVKCVNLPEETKNILRGNFETLANEKIGTPTFIGNANNINHHIGGLIGVGRSH